MSPLKIQEQARKKSLIERKLGSKNQPLFSLKLGQPNNENNYPFNIMNAVKVMGVFCIIIFVLEIWMVNRLSTYGDKIQDIKITKANLELENQVLENSIAEKSSINSVEEKAASLGFNSINNILYIKSPAVASIF